MSEQTSARLARTLRVWTTVWPTLTVLLWVSEPWLRDLPLAIRTALTTGVMVPLVLWVLIPASEHVFLQPTTTRSSC